MRFWKVGARCIRHLGDAVVRVCDAAAVADVITDMLKDNPDLFSDNHPLDHTMHNV